VLTGVAESAEHWAEQTQDHQAGGCTGAGSSQPAAGAHLSAHLGLVQCSTEPGWYSSWLRWVACESRWLAAWHTGRSHRKYITL